MVSATVGPNLCRKLCWTDAQAAQMMCYGLYGSDRATLDGQVKANNIHQVQCGWYC